MKKLNKSKIAVEAKSNEEETEEEVDLTPALIIHGASSTKIGFGREKYPRFVYPEQSTDLNERIRRFPIEGSMTTNEELIKAYWLASIKKLKIDPVKNPILISLPTAELTDSPFRDLVLEYFHKELLAEKVTVISDPFLSLVAYLPMMRKLNAIIVDIGFSQIRIVPIYQAAILEEHIAQVSFGGLELTLQLGSWLQKQGFEGPIDSMFIRDIKENHCFVRGYKQNMKESDERPITYYIDKYTFSLGSQRWKLPELFFYKKFFSERITLSPRSDCEGNKFDMKENNLPQAIANVIKSLNIRLWDEFSNNICLTGGGSKFLGLKKRLEDELAVLLPECKNSIRILSTQQTDLMPYVGASKFAMLDSIDDYWQTADDFETGEYEIFL
jgi:actin-related protein